MIHVGLTAICFLQIVLGVFADGYYSVLAPGTLHSAHKYNVSVSVHNVSQPCTLKIGITGPSYNETKTVDLSQSDDLKLLEFDVPHLEKGHYNVTAEGVSGLIFYNTTRLNYEAYVPYTHIQTDKGIYKPGDEVKYRIIFLDENLKPTRPLNSTSIFIEDNKKNRIKEIKDFEVRKGVYSGTFQLSEYAGLGAWSITVKTPSSNYFSDSVIFMVKKYVLPKFAVTMEVNELVAVPDGDMHAVVRANYTYGEPVNGEVTLVAEIEHRPWFIESEDNKLSEITPIITKADMVGGKAKFHFNVKEFESKISSKYPSTLLITSTVEEEFTGVKLNATTHATLFPYRYQMICISYDTCYNYQPDKEFEVIFEILYIDGSPVRDTKAVIHLTYTEKYEKYSSNKSLSPPDANQSFVFDGHLDINGTVAFKVKLPDLADFEGYGHFFEATVTYADEKKVVVNSFPRRERKKQETDLDNEPKDYLRVYANYPKDNYSIYEDTNCTITVNSSRPLSYFVYTIVGRGNILHVEKIELPEPTNVTTFEFIPTYAMAPYARIYIHYVEDGKYYFAEANVYISWDFKNKISIEAPQEVKVGDEVSFRIKTEPNSFVGLRGVDQSVLLLNRGNDIEESSLSWQIGGYSTYTPYQGGYSTYPGQLSGLVTLTNANYFYNRTEPQWDRRAFSSLSSPKMESGMSLTQALSGGGAGYSSQFNEPMVRKNFAETWIFADIENTDSETFTFVKKIPDTITTWVISGFSLNPEKGFASTKEDTKIKAFLPFFISIRLPYSVKRGELISVPALVFNYLSKNLDVEVTLENTDDEFEFVDATNEIISIPKQSKMVQVPSNSAKGVSFMLRPKVIGTILLKFTAVSPLAGDAIHKPLKVVPEGITQYVNRAFFVNLKNSSNVHETFKIEVPSQVVPDSEHAEFTAIGDLLGPLLNNFDNFIRLPTGCGEQTMSKLMLNFLILRYLEVTKTINKDLEARIKSNLERGYQNLLRFQHKDGSFSSFGPGKDLEKEARNGSTWLTAYVARSLVEFGEIIKTDPMVVDKAMKYLIERQVSNGSFTELGDLFYQSQGKEFSLTTSVCLTILEIQKTTSKYNDQLKKALEYIVQNIDKSNDLRMKSLGTYTLHQAKHAHATKSFTELLAQSKSDGDRRWWSSSNTESSSWRWSLSDEVETTSYILLTLLEQQSATSEDVLQIIKWLVGQRNSYGGFSSTQDTVVGLKALIKFAEKSEYLRGIMNIGFKAQEGIREMEENITLNDENALLLQTVELPTKTKNIEFHAQGKGSALIQISYQYNILQEEPAPSFSLNTQINRNTPPHKLEMDVCVDYLGENGESNMAVMEVTLPSGYEMDVSSFDKLEEVDHVMHVETKNSDTTLVIYFDSLKKNDMKCLTVEAFKSYAVALQKPVPVIVYDYYDTSRKATTFYEVVSNVCDICDTDNSKCNEICQ